MKKTPFLAAAALAVAVAPVAHAQEGTDATAKSTFQGKVVVKKGNKATLKVRYNCAKGETLWISAKQLKSGKKGAALTKEGSSKVAAAWWQSHRNAITCDGAKHTAKFTMDKVEPGSKGTLKKGFAWVQFCITSGEGDAGELNHSHSAFVAVKKA